MDVDGVMIASFDGKDYKPLLCGPTLDSALLGVFAKNKAAEISVTCHLEPRPRFILELA